MNDFSFILSLCETQMKRETDILYSESITADLGDAETVKTKYGHINEKKTAHGRYHGYAQLKKRLSDRLKLVKDRANNS